MSDQEPNDTEEWPQDVHRLTISELGHFGVHKDTREVYWKGKRLATIHRHQLHGVERALAGMAAFSAVLIALIEVGRSMQWWP